MDELRTQGKGQGPPPRYGNRGEKSICTICDPMTQCCLDLFVKDGEIIRVEGSKEAPHSHGTLCAKGAATRQHVYSEERVKTPLRRVGERGSGEFERITWDEALDEVASKLNAVKAEHGAESVVFFAGYPSISARSCSGCPSTSARRTTAPSRAPARRPPSWRRSSPTERPPQPTWPHRSAACSGRATRRG